MIKHCLRLAVPSLVERLGVMPAVVVTGVRQTGKSTLVQELIPGSRRFFSLDDLDALDLARRNPAELLAGTGPVTIDEVQKPPDLLPEVKRAVDQDLRPGRFPLTGSADLLLMSQISESLAGRASYLTLWPMTHREQQGRHQHNAAPVRRPTIFSTGGTVSNRAAISTTLAACGDDRGLGRLAIAPTTATPASTPARPPLRWWFPRWKAPRLTTSGVCLLPLVGRDGEDMAIRRERARIWCGQRDYQIQLGRPRRGRLIVCLTVGAGLSSPMTSPASADRTARC